VLERQHAGGEAVGGVVGAHRHHALDDDRPGVDLGAQEMHRAAVEAQPGRERAPVGVEAAQGRQQRGMDVEHAITPAFD
jgi:hypothetical protein